MSSLLWAAIGGGIVLASMTQRIGTWQNPGPGFLPLLCGVVLAVLGLGVVAQEWRCRERTGRGLLALPPGLDPRAIGLALASLLGYALLLERAGYLIVTFAFLALMLRSGRRLRWGRVLATALLSTVASYALFRLWLGVPLPPWPAGS